MAVYIVNFGTLLLSVFGTDQIKAGQLKIKGLPEISIPGNLEKRMVEVEEDVISVMHLHNSSAASPCLPDPSLKHISPKSECCSHFI